MVFGELKKEILLQLFTFEIFTLVINLQQTVVLDAVSLVVCKNLPQYLATVVAGTVVMAAIVAVTPPGIYDIVHEIGGLEMKLPIKEIPLCNL